MPARVASIMSPTIRLTLLPLIVLSLMHTGCAQYRYHLTQPEEVAGSIPARESISVEFDPLVYQLREVQGALGISINNPTEVAITLLGERSYIVDPTRETHPIRSGTIAPNSHITLMLPPQPRTTRAGPRVGFGVGVGTGYRGAGVGTGFYGDRWGGHHRHSYVIEGEPRWRWTTGPVRMRLVYDRNGEHIEHNFSFDRVRVR